MTRLADAHRVFSGPAEVTSVKRGTANVWPVASWVETPPALQWVGMSSPVAGARITGDCHWVARIRPTNLANAAAQMIMACRTSPTTENSWAFMLQAGRLVLQVGNLAGTAVAGAGVSNVDLASKGAANGIDFWVAASLQLTDPSPTKADGTARTAGNATIRTYLRLADSDPWTLVEETEIPPITLPWRAATTGVILLAQGGGAMVLANCRVYIAQKRSGLVPFAGTIDVGHHACESPTPTVVNFTDPRASAWTGNGSPYRRDYTAAPFPWWKRT